MNRVFVQVCIFLGLVLLVQLARMPYGSYRTSLLPIMRQAGKNAGIVSLDATAIDLQFPLNLRFKELRIILGAGRIPIPVFIDSSTMSLRWLSLLLLQADVAGDIHLYQGKALVRAKRSLFGGAPSADIQLQGIQLDAHPVLGALGVKGSVDAKADLKFAEPDNTSGGVEQGTLTATLSNGAYRGGLVGGFVTLPKVDTLGLTIKAALAKQRLELSKLSLTSSLGNAEGSGSAELGPSQQIQTGKLTANIELTEDGKASSLGQYLAALSMPDSNSLPQNAANADISKSFQLVVDFAEGRLRGTKLTRR